MFGRFKKKRLRQLMGGSPKAPVDDPVRTELVSHRGQDYLSYLGELTHAMGSKTYLEIGTNFGSSLAPISCASIAVDPTFRLTMEVVGTKKVCLFYQMTSDEFFSGYDPAVLLGAPLDVAFLDGMHLYEFLLRDILNTEKYCHRQSLIVLHDCVPSTFEMTNRQFKPATGQYDNYWTGDVWKVLPIIRRLRPDLKLVYLDCPPTGLVVIASCDPHSTVLKANYELAVKEFEESPADMGRLADFITSIDVISSRSLPAKALWDMLKV